MCAYTCVCVYMCICVYVYIYTYFDIHHQDGRSAQEFMAGSQDIQATTSS